MAGTLALLVLLALQAEPAKLHFEAPSGAKKEECWKAAKAVQARAAAYGFKGIAAAVESRGDTHSIIVTSEVPFTDASKSVLTRFAIKPASRVEIRSLYEMSGAEQQQFGVPHPSNLADVVAPQNTEWLRVIDAQLAPSSDGVVLLRKGFRLPKDSLVKPKAGDRELENVREVMFWRLSDAGRKRLAEAKMLPHGEAFSTTMLWLVIDGQALPLRYFETPGMVYDKAGREVRFVKTGLYLRDDSKMWGVIDLFIQNPLPFALKPMAK